MSSSISSQNSAILAVIERTLLMGEPNTLLQDILKNDPVNINISSTEQKLLPSEFPRIAPKLHKNYLYWQHLCNTSETTQLTFYRYLQAGITEAVKKVTETGTPIEEKILLILETRLAFITLNSLIIASEDYFKADHLQDAKESVDTALSTLYEFIKTRETLEPSLQKAIESIREDIINESETYQYASYLVTQVVKLKDSPLISEAKFYVVRHQLEKLGETLFLLIPSDGKDSLSQSVDSQKINQLMTQLLCAMVEEEAYITTIRHASYVYSVSFSPDGIYLAMASSDKTAKLIEVATGKEITTIKHKNCVDSVSFSLDSTYLATISEYGTAKLIEVATGKEVTAIRHEDRVNSVSFSPDGTYLATVSDDATVKLINLRKLSQLIDEKKNQPTPLPPQTTAIVHIEKPEAFFLAWLRTESNHHSFYEYMVTQAQQAQDGLSVKYSLPILDTNLLLQSLGFLLLNAEKHYQTVYPTLMGIDDREICLMAMQDMKQSISAALSSLYEFIATRMKLDREDYNQGIERLKKEIEQQIDNTELLLQIHHKLQVILQLECIKNSGELQTLKEMLTEMETIFQPLLPEVNKVENPDVPVIAIKQNLKAYEIVEAIDNVGELEIVPLLSFQS